MNEATCGLQGGADSKTQGIPGTSTRTPTAAPYITYVKIYIYIYILRLVFFAAVLYKPETPKLNKNPKTQDTLSRHP